MKPDPTHRIVIAESEVNDLVETLKHYQHEFGGLNKPSRNFLAKLVVLQAKIGIGAATPAYVATGVKKVSAITVENLGGTEEDSRKYPDISAITSVPTVPTVTASSPKLPAHASLSPDDLDAQLERLNAEMLSELAAAGNPNVVISERRKVPRDTEAAENGSGDAELFKSL